LGILGYATAGQAHANGSPGILSRPQGDFVEGDVQPRHLLQECCKLLLVAVVSLLHSRNDPLLSQDSGTRACSPLCLEGILDVPEDLPDTMGAGADYQGVHWTESVAGGRHYLVVHFPGKEEGFHVTTPLDAAYRAGTFLVRGTVLPGTRSTMSVEWSKKVTPGAQTPAASATNVFLMYDTSILKIPKLNRLGERSAWAVQC